MSVSRPGRLCPGLSASGALDELPSRLHLPAVPPSGPLLICLGSLALQADSHDQHLCTVATAPAVPPFQVNVVWGGEWLSPGVSVVLAGGWCDVWTCMSNQTHTEVGKKYWKRLLKLHHWNWFWFITEKVKMYSSTKYSFQNLLRVLVTSYFFTGYIWCLTNHKFSTARGDPKSLIRVNFEQWFWAILQFTV